MEGSPSVEVRHVKVGKDDVRAKRAQCCTKTGFRIGYIEDCTGKRTTEMSASDQSVDCTVINDENSRAIGHAALFSPGSVSYLDTFPPVSSDEIAIEMPWPLPRYV